jgi:hypothetical protein
MIGRLQEDHLAAIAMMRKSRSDDAAEARYADIGVAFEMLVQQAGQPPPISEVAVDADRCRGEPSLSGSAHCF